jgi:ABC-type phosphate transport system substrate-binding protein
MARRRWLVGFLGFVTILASWSDGAVRAAPGKTTLAIVAQKASALDGLTMRELKRAYIGEHVGGPDGTKIIPLNQGSGSPERVEFERLVLGMSPDDVARFWMDRKIRGQSGAPKSVPSAELLRRVVATLPGAIGYLARTDVGTDLKLLEIDGKRPGEPGYPLEY